MRPTGKFAPQSPSSDCPVQEQCANQESLDEFVWELFNFWMLKQKPGQYRWLFSALGLLGSDAIALKLAPLIEEWAKPVWHHLAYEALSCLCAIGTETALTQVSTIIYRPFSVEVTAKAVACLQAVAHSRNLSRYQLEDQIVPTFQLDYHSSRVIDFGSRQFTCKLDTDLQLKIQDKSGNYCTVPKRGQDNWELASAIASWKQLKQQLAKVIKVQSLRLEQAMITGYRWQWQEFETWVVQHPVMAHLARLLIWQGFSNDGGDIGLFRITEDKTYADISDNLFATAEIIQVGIAHTLNLSPAERLAWSELLSDYEIVQPFAQISRSIFTLEPEQLVGQEIQQFQGVGVFALALGSAFNKLGWIQIRQWRGSWRGYCTIWFLISDNRRDKDLNY